MGRIVAICMSVARGTPKQCGDVARLVADWGLDGDAHAGNWERQISILPEERIDEFRQAGADVAFGAFGENLVISGIDWEHLKPGDKLALGEAVVELTKFGKECHSRCHIYESMGDCIMPRHGMFARVLRGGTIRPGTPAHILAKSIDETPISPSPLRGEGRGEGVQSMPTRSPAMPDLTAAVITVSDKCHHGLREDLSGPAASDILEIAGFELVSRHVVPDEQPHIEALLRQLCDADTAAPALIITTGGTGFSPRDVTPEATLAVAERLCPGIPEAMRSLSLAKTKRAMLSRAVAGIRHRTLICNLPGSPDAVRECLEFVLDELAHGLAVLRGSASECGKEKPSHD